MATAVPGAEAWLSREASIPRITLIPKGLDGLLELVGGALLLILRPARFQGVAGLLTREEPQEDVREYRRLRHGRGECEETVAG